MKAKTIPLKVFHSQAQREKCKRLVADKMMSQEQFDQMEQATQKHTPLPERKAPKK